MKLISMVTGALFCGRFLTSTLRRKAAVTCIALGLVAVLSVVLVSQTAAFPPRAPEDAWLARKGTGSILESLIYYTTINAPLTFQAWKNEFGFDGTNEIRAAYYNFGDLGFGRDMHCRRNYDANGLLKTTACYVVNHGLAPGNGSPGSPPELPVADAILGERGKNSLAAVAMVYNHSARGTSFYVYNQISGTLFPFLLPQVALDTEGLKNVPHLCLPCHGGTFNTATNTVTGASFLPFDTAAFRFSQRIPFTKESDDQQENFRQLNEIVLGTNPAGPIQELINGWYKGQVNVSGTKLDEGFVPNAYRSNQRDEAFYRNVFAPYCRTCHVAQGISLSSPNDINALNAAVSSAVFSKFYMPNSEQTNHNFWSSPAPALLAKYLADLADGSNTDRGQVFVVTGPSPNPLGCQKDNCSLRDAVIAANDKGKPGNRAIITFASDGTFILTEGQLKITGTVIILGNGVGKTIIDGGGRDRVLHVHEGADAIIQGVTIQGGSAVGVGGGIFNERGRLILNSSQVKKNVILSGSGAGLAAEGPATTEVNNSTIGPDNRVENGAGGGISNGAGGISAIGHDNVSLLSLNNSTVSGNTAKGGGGIANGHGRVTLTHTTVTGNNGTGGEGGGILNRGSFVFDGEFNFSQIAAQNSIVGGNSSSSEPDCGNDGVWLGGDYNLLGKDGVSSCPVGATDIIVDGGIETVLDTVMRHHGGQVPHHGLVAGSDAIDAIPLGPNCSPPSYDQRNTTRPVDGNSDGTPKCDIGAHELVPPQLIDNLVTFNVLFGNRLKPFHPPSDHDRPPSGCPTGFVEKFSFFARLVAKSTSSPLSDLLVQVQTLGNANLLQNADGGPAGEGATLTVPEPETSFYSDGTLGPSEIVDVPFVICLKNTNPFSFFVDVLGVVK